MQVTTYGLDLAKSVMQLHWVNMETGEIHRKQLKRRALLEFLPTANRVSWRWGRVVAPTIGLGNCVNWGTRSA